MQDAAHVLCDCAFTDAARQQLLAEAGLVAGGGGAWGQLPADEQFRYLISVQTGVVECAFEVSMRRGLSEYVRVVREQLGVFGTQNESLHDAVDAALEGAF